MKELLIYLIEIEQSLVENNIEMAQAAIDKINALDLEIVNDIQFLNDYLGIDKIGHPAALSELASLHQFQS